MLHRLLLVAALMPFSVVAQTLDAVRFIQQFSERGAEITDEYRKEFFDAGGVTKLYKRVVVESKPINFTKEVMLITSVPEPSDKAGTRLFLFSATKNAHSGPCRGFMGDDKEATFEKIPGDLLIFTYFERGKPKERLLTIIDGWVYEAGVKLKFNEYSQSLSNNFKLTPGEATLILKDKVWGSLKLKQMLSNGSITADEERILQIVVRNGPRHAGNLTQTFLQPYITTKETGLDVNGFWGGLVQPIEAKRDTCFSNMDGIKVNDGYIIGITRVMVLDKGPKVTYSFAWFTGSQMGNVLFLDSDSRSAKQPFPEVSIVADRFIKIVSHDGAGKAIPHYAVLRDGDVMLLSQLPKDEMPLFRNQIFARHGYIFKNPVYQNYFGVYDWYKPEYDDAEMVSGKLMSADERAIATQLAELEKKP